MCSNEQERRSRHVLSKAMAARYRETQMALAHVNRVATSVSILICHLAVSTCRGISNLEL